MLDSPHRESGFSREQKMGFIFMLIFAILTISLGSLQLRNTIYGPFVVRAPKNTLATVTNDEDTRLKSIDTDRDGLNDYDELFQYETSPYLNDTDSDGLVDKIEIEKGSDPLCPENGTCATAEVMAGATTSSLFASPISNVITPDDVLQTTAQMTQQNPQQNAAELEALIANPVQLRALILSTGKINQTALDKIDDASLQKLARQLFNNPASVIATTSSEL